MSGIRSGTGNAAGTGRDASRLSQRAALQHGVQRVVVALAAPLWVPLAVATLRFGFGYRVADVAKARREFRRLRQENDGPLLLCANHLTLIDSLLIAWALASPWHYAAHPDSLAWNTPETKNFAANPLQAAVAYLAKCIPIARGGRRQDAGAVLSRVIHLTERGELALIFPEGGRSRSGRVDVESAAWGVGRIVGSLPGCRVACVYLRGEKQETWSQLPARGDRFHIEIACIEPKSDHRGARRSRDLAGQIVSQLVTMEREYFDGRQ